MAHPAASEIQADSASLRGPIRVEFPESCGVLQRLYTPTWTDPSSRSIGSQPTPTRRSRRNSPARSKQDHYREEREDCHPPSISSHTRTHGLRIRLPVHPRAAKPGLDFED